MAGSYDSFVLIDTTGVSVLSPSKLADILDTASWFAYNAYHGDFTLGFDPAGDVLLDLLATCIRGNIGFGEPNMPLDIDHVQFATTLEYFENRWDIRVCGDYIGYLAKLCRVTTLN